MQESGEKGQKEKIIPDKMVKYGVSPWELKCSETRGFDKNNLKTKSNLSKKKKVLQDRTPKREKND